MPGIDLKMPRTPKPMFRAKNAPDLVSIWAKNALYLYYIMPAFLQKKKDARFSGRPSLF